MFYGVGVVHNCYEGSVVCGWLGVLSVKRRVRFVTVWRRTCERHKSQSLQDYSTAGGRSQDSRWSRSCVMFVSKAGEKREARLTQPKG